jgi:hypothetical protein
MVSSTPSNSPRQVQHQALFQEQRRSLALLRIIVHPRDPKPEDHGIGDIAQRKLAPSVERYLLKGIT